MSLAEKIKFTLNGKDYYIDSKKTIFVLSKLKNEEINFQTEEEIIDAIKEFKLDDEIFLERITNI